MYRADTAPVAGISRSVAIKRIMSGFVRGDTAILDETRIWVKLSHPNIVSVIDFGEEDGDWFVALELVEGVTASELVKHSGALPIPEALTIVERVAKALAYAHTLEEDGRPLNIVHRDVKPANILISTTGQVKLTDFGIARAANRQSRTAVGILKGSLSTLSPEQVREEPVDARSDLFALGSTLHHLLMGAPMFDLSLERLLSALEKNEVPPPPESLPPKIRQLLGALTAPERERRPASAADVAKAIRMILSPTLPDDVEPALAARARSVREKIDRETRAERPSRTTGAPERTSGPGPVPPSTAEAPTGADLDRTTARSGERAAGEETGAATVRGAGWESTGERSTAPPSTRAAGSRAEETARERPTRPSADRVSRTGDERTSDDIGALLPKDDLLDAPKPVAPARDDSTEIGARAKPERPSDSRPPPPRPESATPPTPPLAAPPPSPLPSRRPPERPSRASRPSGEPAAIRIDKPKEDPPPSSPARVLTSDGDSFELPLPGLEPPPRRERTMTGRILAVAARPSRKALLVFALAMTVIALIAVPEVSSRLALSRCASGALRLTNTYDTRGALAAAAQASELEAGCPPDAVLALRPLRLRALAFAGDTRSARTLLPPPGAGDPSETLAVASLAFAEGDWKEAEGIGAKLAKELGPARGAPAACLAAAAAINRDDPGRAEELLRSVNGDCVRILRAATQAQQGETRAALALLKTRPSSLEMRAAHESALGRLHLLLNDQDAANADATAAVSEARHDALLGRPYLWYTTHSPRGGAMVLRVSGPMDDPVLHALLLAGDAARARGSLDLALKYFDEAAARGGRSAIAEVRAASVLEKQGKPQLARGRLARALSLDPKFAPALVQLALLEEESDRALAVEHARAALAIEPENRDARRIAGSR